MLVLSNAEVQTLKTSLVSVKTFLEQKQGNKFSYNQVRATSTNILTVNPQPSSSSTVVEVAVAVAVAVVLVVCFSSTSSSR
jgi:hypothetical protein